MHKSLIATALIFLLSCSYFSVTAQSSFSARHAIAVFAPLSLDSAFSSTGDFNFGKNFPKFLSPGLEFYEGVQLAADSLNRTGAAIDVYVYDTRSPSSSVKNFSSKPEFNKIELIIGNVAFG